ncbi:unnamed protein product [Darwinula stevensoni]|uniref:Uncharacterized protein n=1 Tax=Darwinula stevensoni TaxID=69355 RepID=A0A7R9A4P8_9CRUS|nr:unnamed protein product [Darwinula stevensoni]CAG0893984.1 unnamed protein product [Darwinula stevensoni]
MKARKPPGFSRTCPGTTRAMLLSSVIIVLLWNWGKVPVAEGSEEEMRLQEALFKSYRKVRPVEAFQEPITIVFRLGLLRILKLDQRRQILNTLAAVVERWNDTHLRWNPDEYGGIRQTVILYESAWVPDIILYNSASEAYSDGLLTTNLVVEHTGERNYSDPCCVLPFSAVEYSITISRKAMFFLVINYVLPMVVVNVIAFLVPCESGEKVTLGIATMLNMIIFLTSIRDLLPPTEQIPLIGKFYCVCICLVGLEVGLSIFTLYLHHMEGIPLPKMIQDLCRILSKLPFMRQPKFIKIGGRKEEEKGKKEKDKDMGDIKKAWVQRSSFPFFFDDLVRKLPKEPSHTGRAEKERQSGILLVTEEQKKRGCQEVSWTARQQPDFQANLANWRTASKILDRFFLYLFTVLNITLTIGIMLYTPN